VNRRTILAWCMYDFGNSAFAVLFPVMYSAYFQRSIVGDTGGAGDEWWGATVSVSMLAVALTSPFVGGIADHAGIRKRMLGLYTGVAIAAVLSFSAVPPGAALLGFAVGVFANFAFEGGTVFYNAYLRDIAPPSHQGRVSGWGFAVGYVGSLVALAIAAPLASAGLWTWIWVALALQWGLAALPTFLAMPADRREGMGVLAAARRGFRDTARTLKDVWGMKDLRNFLIAFFFFMDGVNTVIVFASDFSRDTLGFTVAEAIGLIALVQVTALAGSLLMAGPTDRLGPRWTVRVTLLWWIGVVIAAYFAEGKLLFLGVAVLAGLGLGSIQAASRAFMSRLIPLGREAEMFGFYSLCGKTGSIMGPVLYSQISSAAGDQRPAVLSVAAFYVVGYLLLGRVRLPARPEAAP
jgi:UMF1 family MFS transporter